MTNFLYAFGGLLNGAAPWSVRTVGVSTQTEAATAASWDAAVLALWQQAAFTLYIPALTTLTFTSASTASAAFKQTTKTTTNHNIAGTSASKAVDYRQSVIVTMRTAKATRYGHGRMYLPGLASNAIDSTTGYIILPAAMTALKAAVDAFQAALAGNITLQILHRHGTIDGTVPALSMDAVTTMDMPNHFAVQRRRGDKVVPTRTSA